MRVREGGGGADGWKQKRMEEGAGGRVGSLQLIGFVPLLLLDSKMGLTTHDRTAAINS